jgi:uncharacterized damage-inducible protein DinB
MDANALAARLEHLPAALDALLARLPDADWRWRPPEGGWSILEVVNHLVDEEVEDFRGRVRMLVEDPSGEWPRIEPEAWVTSRRYQERDPADSLRRFCDERAASLAWLRGLTAPRWENQSVRPNGRVVTAAEIASNWWAHDVRHLGQIAKRLHGLAARDAAPFSVEYAG